MQQFYELSKLCSHFKFGEITKKKKLSKFHETFNYWKIFRQNLDGKFVVL